jgi:hypothetical protein
MSMQPRVCMRSPRPGVCLALAPSSRQATITAVHSLDHDSNGGSAHRASGERTRSKAYRPWIG